MKCPNCKSRPMDTTALDRGLDVQSCGKCGGCWIRRDEYTRWLVTHGPTLPQRTEVKTPFDVSGVQDARICPDCGVIMIRYQVGHGLNFFIDRCSSCQGIWLDRNEWDALKAENLHDEIDRVFSSEWQHGEHREKMRQKILEAHKQRLGEDYEKVEEFRKWLQAQPHADRILAYIQDPDPLSLMREDDE